LGALFGPVVPAVPLASRARRDPTEGRFGVDHSAAIRNQRTCRRNNTPAVPLERQTDFTKSVSRRRDLSTSEDRRGLSNYLVGAQ
jgi:hypothetical protein